MASDKKKNPFNLSWPKVQISYYRFNNLAEFLNGNLPAKIWWWILSCDLMDRYCNYSILSKANAKCVYEGKSWIFKFME